ncbi:unnamed protein product, partial [marine sediment metagenome]
GGLGLLGLFALTKAAPAAPVIPPGDIIYTVDGWTVYEDERGRIYRTSAPWSVVEHWMEADGVHRLQLVGSTPFGIWPTHHIFLVGTRHYDVYAAMFAYMDDGYLEGLKHEGWWTDQIVHCAYRPPGTPEWDAMSDLNKFFCSYSPYTWSV